MSKLIPKGWQFTLLEKSLDILSGFPFKSEKFTDDRSKIGLIRIRDLTKQSVETFYDDEYEEEYVVRRDDILIGMDGDFNIVKWNSQAALLNQRICKINARKASGFDTNFLFYSLVPELDLIHKATGATTVKHLSVKDIRQIEKPFPPLPEQQKIAAILTAVDEVIASTQAQISKLKDLKTGMMQELLTKGIGHTEFKDSAVGRIPTKWQVVTFNEIFKEYKYGPRFSSKDYDVNGNVKTIRGTDVSPSGNIHYQQVPIAKIDQGIVDNHALKEGDLVMITTADCGLTAVFHEQDIPYIASAYAIKLTPTDMIDSQLIMYFMQTSIAMIQVESFIRKGTVANLPGSDVMTLLIALPPINEQRKIGSTLSSLDNQISLKHKEVQSSEKLKKALMQDLLTGKVRVSVN